MDSYVNEVDKLNGLNYINWRFKMYTLLEGYNVWEIVTELKLN
jgi:hypothetical protein